MSSEAFVCAQTIVLCAQTIVLCAQTNKNIVSAQRNIVCAQRNVVCAQTIVFVCVQTNIVCAQTIFLCAQTKASDDIKSWHIEATVNTRIYLTRHKGGTPPHDSTTTVVQQELVQPALYGAMCTAGGAAILLAIGLIAFNVINRKVRYSHPHICVCVSAGADPGGARGPCPPPYKILDPPMECVCVFGGINVCKGWL